MGKKKKKPSSNEGITPAQQLISENKETSKNPNIKQDDNQKDHIASTHHKTRHHKKDPFCSKRAIVCWTILVFIVASLLTKRTVDPEDKLIQQTMDAILESEVINAITGPPVERPGSILSKYSLFG